MISTVIFDFDGVLTMDATGSKTTIDYICSKVEVDPKKFGWEYRKYGRDLLLGKIRHEDIWTDLCSDVGIDIDYSLLIESFESTKLNPEIIELICELKSQGIKIGMITDNKKDRMISVVELNGLDKLFDDISISADVGSMKNELKIFEHAIDKLNAEFENCIFIDNSRRNLIAPEELGMKVYFYDDELRDVEGLRAELKSLGVQL